MTLMICVMLATAGTPGFVHCEQPSIPIETPDHSCPDDPCPPPEAKQLMILPKPIRLGEKNEDEEPGGNDDEAGSHVRLHSVGPQIRGQ